MSAHAPRQLLFAIIILFSFCLHALLLVLSSEQHISHMQKQQSQHMLTQLAADSRLPLASYDAVSLSVLLSQYSAQPYLAKISIYDAKDELLVQQGNAPLQQGQVLSTLISDNNQTLGKIDATLKPVSAGEIISQQWLFLVGSAILHTLLWVLYGYVARSRHNENLPEQTADPAHSATQQENTTTTATSKPILINRDDTSFAAMLDPDALHSQTPSPNNAQPTSASIKTTDPVATPQQHTSPRLPTQEDTQLSLLPDSQNTQKLTIWIKFCDPHALMDKLSPEVAQPYYTLCQNLLNHTITELTRQQIWLHQTKVEHTSEFNKDGVEITLVSEHNELSIAGLVIAKLYLMLNHYVYEEHRKIQRFALNVKAGICQGDDCYNLLTLLNDCEQAEQIVILLNKPLLAALKKQALLVNHPKPTTTYEREAAYLQGISTQLTTTLSQLRDEILTEQ